MWQRTPVCWATGTQRARTWATAPRHGPTTLLREWVHTKHHGKQNNRDVVHWPGCLFCGITKKCIRFDFCNKRFYSLPSVSKHSCPEGLIAYCAPHISCVCVCVCVMELPQPWSTLLCVTESRCVEFVNRQNCRSIKQFVPALISPSRDSWAENQ